MTPAHRLAALLLLLTAACGATPPTAPDAVPATPPAAGSASAGARTGTFTGLAGHAASGTARLEVSGSVATITFSADFASTRVPGPFVYLNSGTDVNRGTPLRIAPLQSATGAQTYTFALPSGANYTHVLVWCDPFNVGVGAATLAP